MVIIHVTKVEHPSCGGPTACRTLLPVTFPPLLPAHRLALLSRLGVTDTSPDATIYYAPRYPYESVVEEVSTIYR